jgi:hypothetical protein
MSALATNSPRISSWIFFFPLYWLQPKACSEAALSLLTCMEKTDCVKKGTPLIDCMKDDIASDPCRAQRNAYYMCKHSQLNMRTRIRGVRVY